VIVYFWQFFNTEAAKKIWATVFQSIDYVGRYNL
jgi:hypothetical protein